MDIWTPPPPDYASLRVFYTPCASHVLCDEHWQPESVDEVFARQHGVIAHWQAIACGMTNENIKTRVRSGRWRRLYRGVYCLVGAPNTPFVELLATVAAGGRGALLSGLSAAFVFELPGGRPTSPVELVVPRARRVAIRGVHARQMRVDAHHSTLERGIPTVSPPLLLLTCAAVLEYKRAELLGDEMVRRGLLSLEDAEQLLNEHATQGRPGAKAMRLLLADAVPGSESPAEALAVRTCRWWHLPEPERQIVITDGLRRYRIDLGYREHKILFEVDGTSFHRLTRDTDRDGTKEALLVADDCRWFRTTWAELTERPHQFASRLGTWLGIRPQPPRGWTLAGPVGDEYASPMGRIAP